MAAFAMLSFNSFSQAPESVKYQAVVRDGSNLIVTNQSIGVQLRILEGSPSGTAVYTETFSVTTNQYGLINLEIGTGTTTDDFSAIDWGNGTYFVENGIDVSGGTSYTVMGTSQLLSVPYALHAKQADNVVNDLVDDADADPTNEIQDLSLTGNTLSLSSDATTVDLSGYLDNTDAQSLALSGNSLSISGGNSVTLPSSTGLWTEVAANTHYSLTQMATDAEIKYGIDDLSGMSFGGSNGIFWGSHGFEATGMFTNGNQISFVSPGDFSPNSGVSTIVDFYEEDGDLLASYIDPSGQYFQVSDRSLKQNIVELDNGLSKVLSLNGYSYDYKQSAEDVKKGTPITSGYGIIAQELLEVAPELVTKTGQGHFVVNYSGIVPILIEGIQEQQEMIEDLQHENDELKSRLDAMDARLKAAGL